MGIATNDDLKSMEERQDKRFATKNDILKSERRIKRRLGAERNKIIVNLSKPAINTPTRKEFNELKTKVENYNAVS